MSYSFLLFFVTRSSNCETKQRENLQTWNMNGFSTGSGEEDSRDSKRSHDQHCCLIEFDQMIDDGGRCPRMAGNASYRYIVYSGKYNTLLLIFV